MKLITRAALVLPVLLTPLFASAAIGFSFFIGGGSACTNPICAVGMMFINLINDVLVPLLFAIAFIMFLWGVAKAYILSGGEAEAVSQGHRLILWGIIGFAVMISLWGLVNVVTTTFGLNMAPAPQPPTSY